MKTSFRFLPAWLLLVLAAAFAPCLIHAQAQCTPPPSGVAGWWQAEGNANDFTGTNNAVLSPSGASYATGKVGQGFRFDGTNGFVQIPDSDSLKPSAVTVEAWVWLDPAINSTTNSRNEQIVFKKNTWSAFFEGYSLLKESLPNGDGTYTDRFQFCVSRTGNQQIIRSLTIAQRGVWYHVAATYDGNQSKLFVNGVAEVSGAPGFALDYDTTPVFIGTSGTFAPYLSMFAGIIDEPTIYGRALSTNEIAAIYNAGLAGKCTSPAVTASNGVPVIVSFAPLTATNGALVTILGTNFSSITSSNLVRFGAVQANVLSASANVLTVLVPPGATLAPLTVTASGLTAYSGKNFQPTFFGNGSNTTVASFPVSFNLPGAENTACAVIADFDGDGKADVAFINGGTHNVSIYRNLATNGATLGVASFASRLDLPLPAAAAASGGYRLRAVDLDGDGRLDLIACEVNGSRLTVFHNVATPGSLTTNSFAVPFMLNAGNDCRNVAAADLDADGRVDIVSVNLGDNSLAIFKNIGAPGILNSNSFAAPFTLASPGSPYEVVIADLDGDGRPDLAVVESSGNILSLFQNLGTPGSLNMNSFAAHLDFPAGTEAETLVAVDLDGDGKLDLAVGSVKDNSVNVFRNTHSGGLFTTNSFAAYVPFGTPGWMHTVAVADFNGDAKPDLGVVGELGSYMAVFQNTATPGIITANSFAPRVDFGTGWNPWGIAAGDLDGDGRPDVVFCNQYDNNIQIYQNQSPFGSSASTNPPPVCIPVPSGLVGWWQGESDATDVLGGNNGTIQGATNFAPGEVSQSFAMNGSSGAVRIPASASLNVGLAGGMTAEAWLYPSNTSPQPVFEWSLDSNPNNYEVSFWRGHPFFPTCNLYCAIVDTNGTGHEMFSYGPITSGDFQHVAMTYDKATGIGRLFINGQVVVESALGTFTPKTMDNLYLGARPPGDPYSAVLNGRIDEAAIYNRALTTNEIAAIYAAGSAGKCYSPTAPFITAQPTNQTVTISNAAMFAVTADGSPMLNYQWRFNGANIIGATNSTFTLNNVSPAQGGNYSVVVTNFVGSVTSSNALLTVYVPPTPPIILAQTPSQVVLVSNAATFTVNAGGTAPLSYFWSLNNVLIPGATNFSYTLFNAQLADSGSRFSCLVTNLYGLASSTNALLKVIDTVSNDLCSGAVVITSYSYTNAQSTVRASSFGDPVPGCVDGFGNGVWYQFTASVSGLMTVDTFGSDFDTGIGIYAGDCGSLVELACNDDDGGPTSRINLMPTVAGTTYHILVGGYGAHVGNLVFHLNYFTPPAFDVSPTNISVIVSSNGMFGATVSGTQPISLQWYFNNTPLVEGGRISGTTNAALNITGVITNDGGNYFVVASNWVGVTTSSVAVLTPIILPPVIIVPPVAQSVLAGSNVNFFALVDGTPPYSFQWSLNGTPLTDDTRISGSTMTSLTISNLVAADAGIYSLAVVNPSGSVSIAATLTVLVPPSVVVSPVGRSVPPGLPTTFTASGTGIPAPSHQWQFNGANIPAAIGTTYGIGAVGTNNLGLYHIVVSNSVGVVTSVDAQLTFGPVAAWGRNLNNESLPPPGLSNVIAISGTYGVGFAVRADGRVIPWGGTSGSPNVTNVPASASNVVAIATSGTGASVVLRADGRVVGWNGITLPALSNIVSVAVGTGFGMAVRADGVVIGWGATPYSTVPAGLSNVKAVACGNSHTVALKTDGTVAMWGTGTGTNVPAGLTGITAVAAGSVHSLALRTNGTVVAWGSGVSTNLPTAAAGLTNIIAISAGSYTDSQSLCLALRADGIVFAWGSSANGENVPPIALKSLFSVAVSAAPSHGLALVNDGTPQILQSPVGLSAYTARDVTLSARAVGVAPLNYQWIFNGTNLDGATNSVLALPNIQTANAGSYQLFVSNALGTVISLAAPVTVISNSPLTFLTSNLVSATNIYQGGTVKFTSGTVQGSGPLRYQWFTARTNNLPYAAVAGATNDTLVLDPAFASQSGFYYLAVSNLVGGITSAPVNITVQFAKAWGFQVPTNVPVITNAIAIATGGTTGIAPGQYFAIGADGKLTGWTNSISSSAMSLVSFPTLSNSLITAVAASYLHQLVLKSDGTVSVFGNGATNVPNNLSGVTAIAAGGTHDLALKSDGTIVGWLSPAAALQQNYGQATNPVSATNVVAIAAGYVHSLALRADGSVVAWGYGSDGSTTIPFTATNVVAIAAGGFGTSSGFSLALRGDGIVVGWGNVNSSYPVPAGLSNVVAISAGGQHATALKRDGTVVTWGYEYVGLAASNLPPDLTNVIALTSGGDHDLALFGTRAPAFTVQPWNRAVTYSKTGVTTITLAGKCVGVQPMSYQWRLNGTNLPANFSNPSATNDTLTLRGDPPSQLPVGTYQLVASNAYGVAISKPVKVTLFIPLGEAVDATNLAWLTSGNAQWYGQTNITHDGLDAARSGGIGGSQETILQTTLVTNISGNVSFWWKVSSEQFFDTLEFRVNGTVQASISGEVDWTQANVPITAGTNLLQWRYSKDGSFDSGLDAAFVDQFAFVSAPIINLQPAGLVADLGANVTLSVAAVGAPTLRYQWRQNGVPVGGNSPVLALNSVSRAQNGTYSVTVTNSGGMAVSSNALVIVRVPQLLGLPVLLPDGSLQFTSTDANGGLAPADISNFEAQATTDLVNWTTLTNALSLTNGMLQLNDATRTNFTTRFYRILEH